MINAQVFLAGNLGGLEGQYTPQGKLIAKGTLAVNSGSGEKQETDWYEIVAWEKTAEILVKVAEKGTAIVISGNQRINNWTDRDGNKHTKVVVTVHDFRVTARGRKKEEAGEDEPEFMQGE